MPFIQNQPNPAAAFGQGWNAIMNLYGNKLQAAKEQRQQEQFDKQFKLQKQQFDLEMKVKSAELQDIEREQKQNKYLEEAIAKLDPNAEDYQQQLMKTWMLIKPGSKVAQEWLKTQQQEAKEKNTADYKESLEEITAYDPSGKEWKGSRQEYAILKRNNPQYTREKPEGFGKSDTQSYDKNLLVAAQALGIPPNIVKSGKLTPEQADLLGKKYIEMFGTQTLLQMLMSGQLSGSATDPLNLK